MPPLRMLGLLMLLFSLCDADSSCPADLNPLVLDPPKVLEEYGKSVLVNCTSTDDDHDGIYWRVGNTDSQMETENSFITWSASLSNWDEMAECRLKLNETFECSKDLDITVYKNPDIVVMYPTNYVPLLEGMLCELQCDIINVAPVQNLTVRWYKDNQTIKTDFFTNTTKRPVTESSTLAVNISRAENGAQFRCEAQLDFGPRGPKPPPVSDTHNVSVHYAPELENKWEDVSVNESNDVTLNCEAEGYPPPVFHWTRDGEDILENTNNLIITGVNTSATYKCTATNKYGSITKQMHVYVIKTVTMAAPAAITTPAASTTPASTTTPAATTTREPPTPRGCPIVLTPAEIVVRFGDPASINCSTSAADVVGMGWEATSGGTGFKDPPAVTWAVEKLEDWAIDIKCYITLHNNTQCTVPPTITLYKTPDIVSVSASDQGPMVEGTEYMLKCDIINVAPVQKLTLTWYRGFEAVHTQTFNDTSAAPVNVSSLLRITAKREDNRALFRCEAELHLGSNGKKFIPTVTSSPYIANVNYKPLIQACPSHVDVEHEFSLNMLSCKADGNPPPTIQWHYEGELINASQPLNRDQSGKYTAEVVNSLGRSNTSVDITIEYGPLFTCDDHYEVKENDKLPCEPKGIPKPVITWRKDGKQIDSPQHWTKYDSGKYSLEATNEHGTANHTLYLAVLYAPVFKEGTYEIEMIQGGNMTFDCNAEGNPPPEIHWNYTTAGNVRETTRGRQKSINITGATSTNAGVYRCVATNRVGSVTRSVTLTMKGKTSAVPLTVIWWLLIILIVVLILIFMIVVHNRRKKHGQYSFVPNSTDRSIPMTPQSNGV